MCTLKQCELKLSFNNQNDGKSIDISSNDFESIADIPENFDPKENHIYLKIFNEKGNLIGITKHKIGTKAEELSVTDNCPLVYSSRRRH